MDILHLVDRLEEIFNAGTAIPLSHKLMVDEDRVLEEAGPGVPAATSGPRAV